MQKLTGDANDLAGLCQPLSQKRRKIASLGKAHDPQRQLSKTQGVYSVCKKDQRRLHINEVIIASGVVKIPRVRELELRFRCFHHRKGRIWRQQYRAFRHRSLQLGENPRSPLPIPVQCQNKLTGRSASSVFKAIIKWNSCRNEYSSLHDRATVPHRAQA
jgi:hypothetical protein